MRKIDWANYNFRCSQLYKLNTGTIGLTAIQEARIKELFQERDKGINANGNKCRWTDNKQEELEKLVRMKAAPLFDTMPATMKTELRKIYRAEKFVRNFPFTNKYIQKGIAQEEEGITTYQWYRNNVLKERTFFVKNSERLHGTHWSGEPDLRPLKLTKGKYAGMMCGFDIKCSWDLSTFPFSEDGLVDQYECQNQGYMELEKVGLWITAYVLVNGTEEQVHNEKMKWFYAFKTKEGTPDEPDHKNYDAYIKKLKEVERQMIFDYDRFMDMNPYHQIEHTREEWMDGGYDIPLAQRVIEKLSIKNDEKIEDLKERIEIARGYLTHLDKQEQARLVALVQLEEEEVIA